MNVGEYGVQFVLGVSFDMSSNTSLSLTFTKPDGTTLTVTDPDVTIAASPIVTTAGTFASNTYFLYTFVSGDIDQAGDWSVRGTYNAAGPVHLISSIGYFTIEP